jgi:hypothetical protein
MKKLKLTVIAGLAAWLLWVLFGTAFLTHQSGSTGRGGIPTADRGKLVDFLSSRGFTPCLAPVSQATGPLQECFRGSYQGSRPILVIITTEASNAYGVYVETSYDYRGFRWSVADSSRKAQEFTGTLNSWMTEHRMRSLNARQ